MREKPLNSNSPNISNKKLILKDALTCPPSSITVMPFAAASAAADADGVLRACAGAAAPMDVAGMSDVVIRADRLGDVVPLDPLSSD